VENPRVVRNFGREHEGMCNEKLQIKKVAKGVPKI
jgi:hypothetical protein